MNNNGTGMQRIFKMTALCYRFNHPSNVYMHPQEMKMAPLKHQRLMPFQIFLFPWITS